MPITLNCPKCHKPFRVRDESVGGRVRCPTAACGAILQVPNSLAPASNLGFDVPIGGGGMDPGEISGIHRPMADDVGGFGAMDDMLLGGANRRTAGGAFNPGETALPAPPSIKMRGPSPHAPVVKKPEVVAPANVFQSAPAQAKPQVIPQPQPQPLPAMLPPAPRPVSMHQTDLRPVHSLDDSLSCWRKVRGGLSLIRFGLLFLTLPLLFALGHAFWTATNAEAALKTGPGLLKIANVQMWHEWVLAYTTIPATLGILCLFFGRLKCAHAPAESHAKGLIRGAALFTIVAAVAGSLALAAALPFAAEKVGVTRLSGLTALAFFIPTALLADLCTLLFVGQIGWSIGRPQLQKAVAGLCGFTVLAPAAFVVVNWYYPMLEPLSVSLAAGDNPLAGGLNDDLARRTLIGAGAVAVMVIAILLRYAGVAGSARRAVRQHLGD